MPLIPDGIDCAICNVLLTVKICTFVLNTYVFWQLSLYLTSIEDGVLAAEIPINIF